MKFKIIPLFVFVISNEAFTFCLLKVNHLIYLIIARPKIDFKINSFEGNSWNDLPDLYLKNGTQSWTLGKWNKNLFMEKFWKVQNENVFLHDLNWRCHFICQRAFYLKTWKHYVIWEKKKMKVTQKYQKWLNFPPRISFPFYVIFCIHFLALLVKKLKNI